MALGGYQNSKAVHAFLTCNNWVALFTAGEVFLNNHHDQPATASFGRNWKRSRTGSHWAVVVPLRGCGAATGVRLPTLERHCGDGDLNHDDYSRFSAGNVGLRKHCQSVPFWSLTDGDDCHDLPGRHIDDRDGGGAVVGDV